MLFYVFEKNNIAHGDIQPGNVLVSKDGKNITFVDYDGMFYHLLKDLVLQRLAIKIFNILIELRDILMKNLIILHLDF